MLSLDVDVQAVPVEIARFPAGESRLRILAPQPAPNTHHFARITCRFENNNDLIDLLLLTDAVRRHYGAATDVALRIDYLPYARQDRVCNPGESLPIKVVCDLINSQRYHSVQCMDLHSDVAAALLNNLVHVELTDCLRLRDVLPRDTILVSPDAGANKKVYAFARAAGMPNVVRADKSRDLATGRITGTTVYCGDVGAADFLIVDDICDGGFTFLALAVELRKRTTGRISLYVTHALLTKGVDAFVGLVDRIYTANLMAPAHPLIQVLK
jgi:ribose-phosphate pyrophosphokinase